MIGLRGDGRAHVCALVLLCALGSAACEEEECPYVPPPEEPYCAPDPGESSYLSDDEALSVVVDCLDGRLCNSDQRAFVRGTELEYSIRVPGSLATYQLRVENSDPEVLTFLQHGNDDDYCDDTVVLNGTLRFEAIGDAAVVVLNGETEIDRFSVAVRDVARLELQWTDGPDKLGLSTNYESTDSLQIFAETTLRMILRSDDGKRLIGGRDFAWTIDDADVAELDDEPFWADHAIVLPVALGTTMLHASAGELSADLPIEVVGLDLDGE